MAKFSILPVSRLDVGFILAPERYDPRRLSDASAGPTLAELVSIVSEQVDSRKAKPDQRYLILDTGDAQEGVIHVWKPAVINTEIGSNKKRIKPGDVIISRLRPYLRQVAFADPGLFLPPVSDGEVLISTEFFVLRSKSEQSIAFLVPFLLSTAVQEVLAASQEGGHHPRFNQQALERLSILDSALRRRDEVSSEVESAISSARHADLKLRELVLQFSD